MSNDWIDHDGGPQPVADDVWVEVNDEVEGVYVDLASGVDWPAVKERRILNDHLIAAARLEGIRLGLEAANKAVEALVGVHIPIEEEWAFQDAIMAIRDINSDTIARDVQTISHQAKCDNLHIAREAQDMGSDTSAGTTA